MGLDHIYILKWSLAILFPAVTYHTPQYATKLFLSCEGVYFCIISLFSCQGTVFKKKIAKGDLQIWEGVNRGFCYYINKILRETINFLCSCVGMSSGFLVGAV